ncbi:glucoamylase family protein [Flavihumibacter solisilvae]|uniref:Fibronectin n=1 Tax=Flavihumibacter solisilvae TaxID=1349421 RepID=A0A0C1LKU4_9BACT|nr:glucoamylase family protein [Flavihumibacter solisilvae]KIC95978.1 fibronectin [Flavihumibacter solisilvae]
MKLTIIALLLFASSIVYSQHKQDKIIFENSIMDSHYYYSKAEYSSGCWIKNTQGKLPVSGQQYFTPGNSLELQYRSADDGQWKATVLYNEIRGIDSFNEASHLSFWLYVTDSTEKESLPAVNLLLADKKESGSASLVDYLGSFKMNSWVPVKIPLSVFNKDSHLPAGQIKGVQFSNKTPSKKEGHLFIDQVELLSTAKASGTVSVAPQFLSAKGYEQHIDLAWKKESNPAIKYIKVYRATDGKTFRPVAIQSPQVAGYSDFIGSQKGTIRYKLTYVDNNYRETGFSNSIAASTRSMSDEELLDMIQESSFRYYWEGAEPHSGLALENIPGDPSMVATGASGFGIMAIISAVKRGFITRQQAAQRMINITGFLLKADRFHGVFPHFLDGANGRTVPFFGSKDNGGDLVEMSFLVQGLLTARQFFNSVDKNETQVRNSINKLWKETEWDWYRRYPGSDFLYWHWSPDQEWVINHSLIGWNEVMITYFLAIASPTHGVPVSMYYSGWASQSEKAVKYRAGWGQTTAGSAYSNGNSYFGIPLPVGVSNGGPLFFIHYSFLGLNPHLVTDKYTNYFENNRNIAQINLRYCIENPKNHRGYGDDFWGLTASDGPEHYSANEPNVKNDEGKMTPTGALASFPYTPEASMRALRNYYRNYGKYLYGYYGFRDAIDLDRNWCSSIYMGLNQAPVVVMIENYRTKLLWDLFMSAPEVEAARQRTFTP